MEDVINQDPQKELINVRVRAYHETVSRLASCETLTLDQKGNPAANLSTFREAFRILFTLTCAEKGMKESDAINKVKLWLKEPDLDKGIELFYDYQDLLFKNSILKAR